MKLDLSNSKWWNMGLNDNYLQEQLNKFMALKAKDESINIEEMIPSMLEVRGAEEMEAGSVLQDLRMKSDQKDIRLYTPSAIEIRDVMAEIERETPQLGSPIPQDFGGDAGYDQPFELLNMMSKLDQKDFSRQIFGDKTFDFADLPMEEPEIITEVTMPKDARRRQNFEKMMLISD